MYPHRERANWCSRSDSHCGSESRSCGEEDDVIEKDQSVATRLIVSVTGLSVSEGNGGVLMCWYEGRGARIEDQMCEARLLSVDVVNPCGVCGLVKWAYD